MAGRTVHADSLPCEFGVFHEARFCISGFTSVKADLMVKPFMH